MPRLAMNVPLTLRFFGPALVCVGGAPLPKMRSRKALWLLALLSTRPNRPVSREWIASTLWPDADLSTAFANLRPVFSDLRQVFGRSGEPIRFLDRNTVLLDLTDVDNDVARFDEAMRRGDFAQAVDLYEGPFLEGCHEEWVPQERERREIEVIHASLDLGEQASQVSDYHGALAHFSRAAALDVWRDAPRRGQMQALAHIGDVNAALYVYREFAHFLSAKAAAEPDPATTELYRQLRAHAGRHLRSEARGNVASCQDCRNGLRASADETFCFDVYRFTPNRRLLLRDETPINLGARTVDLLDLLIRRAGNLVGKGELLGHCWPGALVHENNLMVHISALRRALPAPSGSPYIVTEPGRGYRFVAPVRVEPTSASHLYQNR